MTPQDFWATPCSWSGVSFPAPAISRSITYFGICFMGELKLLLCLTSRTEPRRVCDVNPDLSGNETANRLPARDVVYRSWLRRLRHRHSLFLNAAQILRNL